MIIITGSIVIRPEHRTEALALGSAHSKRSRGEPGCIAHNCLSDTEDPNRIVFVEEWADMAAVKVHFAVPASGEFVHQLTTMGDRPPIMRLFAAEQLRN